MQCICWAGRRYLSQWTNNVISHQDFAAKSSGAMRRVSRRPAIRFFSSVKATACDILTTFWEAMVAPIWDADKSDLLTDGGFKTWLCDDEPAAEPATDFVAFLEYEAGVLLMTINEGGTVPASKLFSGPSAKAVERCHLLLDWAGVSMSIGAGIRWGEAAAALLSSDGRPESSRDWSGIAWRGEKMFCPLAKAPGWIAWQCSQYLHPDFFSKFINSLLEFAVFCNDFRGGISRWG